MAEGRDRILWEHSSAVMARIVGLFDSQAVAAEFNPYRIGELSRAAAAGAGGFSLLKGALLSGSFR